MTPFEAQPAMLSGVGGSPMSGRDVPAVTLSAICETSRTVESLTLIPVCALNGFRTSWNAFSSCPPQAVHTVTSPPVWPAADAEGAADAAAAADGAVDGAVDGAGVGVALLPHAAASSAATAMPATTLLPRIRPCSSMTIAPFPIR